MKIDEKIKSNPSAIASAAVNHYGITHECSFGKRAHDDLFRVYITFKNDAAHKIDIEQYNGDDGSYAWPPDEALKSAGLFSKTVDASTPARDNLNDVITTEHTWIRFYEGEYVEFMGHICLLISHAAETHKGKLLDNVKRNLDYLANLKM